MSTIDPKLIAVYEKAVYRVRDNGSWIEFFIGAMNSRLDNALRTQSVTTAAFITACNPRSLVVSAAENQQFHAQLLNTLRAKRLKWLDGEGGDLEGRWEPEKSILILGISKESATALATEYGQNALVWIQHGQPPALVLTR